MREIINMADYKKNDIKLKTHQYLGNPVIVKFLEGEDLGDSVQREFISEDPNSVERDTQKRHNKLQDKYI